VQTAKPHESFGNLKSSQALTAGELFPVG